MAILRNSKYPKHRGHINKQIVIKQYAYKTVVTAYPDMSRVKPSESQLSERNRFKQAIAYARAVVADPAAKARYAANIPAGKRVFQTAVAEFLRKPQTTPDQSGIWIADRHSVTRLKTR